MNIFQMISLLTTGAYFGYMLHILVTFIKIDAPLRACVTVGIVAFIELALFIYSAVCIGVRLI